MYPSAATTVQCRGCSSALCREILMFGTAETRDLCARCTLDYYCRTGGLGAGSSSTGHATCPFPFAVAGTPPAEKQNAVTVRPNRCAVPACPKKVGLLGFACRCGGTFCSVHRHAESHGCDYDYKSNSKSMSKGLVQKPGANAAPAKNR